MHFRTKYWLEHCEVPHGRHDVIMQCEKMFHDKFFWMTLAWGIGIMAMIGLVLFLYFTTPYFSFLNKEVIPPFYPFI